MTKIKGIINKVFGGSKGSKGVVGETLEGIRSIIDEVVTNKEEKAEILRKLKELELRELEQIIKDRESARQMQIEALRQDDKFAKRFIYIFAIVTLVFIGGLWYVLLFKGNDLSIPEQVLYIFVLNTTNIVTLIYAFFYSSSMGSKQKELVMAMMLQMLVEKIKEDKKSNDNNSPDNKQGNKMIVD